VHPVGYYCTDSGNINMVCLKVYGRMRCSGLKVR